jgi:hypothetical protein
LFERLNIIPATKGGKLEIKNNAFKPNVIFKRLLLFMNFFGLILFCVLFKWINVIEQTSTIIVTGIIMDTVEYNININLYKKKYQLSNHYKVHLLKSYKKWMANWSYMKQEIWSTQSKLKFLEYLQ